MSLGELSIPGLRGNGYGLAANKPSAASVPNGYVYSETDTGLLWMIQAAAWQQTPGLSGYGQMIAGPVVNAAAVDLVTLGISNTTTVDLSLSITVPTTANSFDIIWTVPAINASTGTAAAEAAINLNIFETDSSNVQTNGCYGQVNFTQGSTASNKVRQASIGTIISHHVAADSNKTYKLRAVTLAAIPASWTSLKVNAGGTAATQTSAIAVTR